MQSQIRSAEAAVSPAEPAMGSVLPNPSVGVVHTEALRRALRSTCDPASAADLMFLENWELSSIPGVAAALRASQLRRANPALAAEIRAELSASKRRSV